MHRLVAEFGKPGVGAAWPCVLLGDRGVGDQRHGQVARCEQDGLAIKDEAPTPHADPLAIIKV
ncbi:hypothetical protein HEK131_47350 [Streptomyces seoulensis]|nr:hypothetical protein HEK131_47350 [Streptomyces seoulensis]